jgi:hypothetical protein
MIADSKVAQRLEGFVSKVQAETIAYFAKHYSSLTPSTIEVEEGSKFYRIVEADSGSRSVYCFVSKANGDIYKAAGWKAPAKHVRGNIFDANYSYGRGVSLYGGTYLR